MSVDRNGGMCTHAGNVHACRKDADVSKLTYDL